MKLNSVDDIIRCITLGHDKANENAKLYNRLNYTGPTQLV